MSGDEDSPQPVGKDARAAQLAAALRRNLRRRKAQSRARRGVAAPKAQAKPVPSDTPDQDD